MHIKAVEEDPHMLRDVPDQYKTQGMYEIAVEKNPWVLEIVPDHFKTQGMCTVCPQLNCDTTASKIIA